MSLRKLFVLALILIAVLTFAPQGQTQASETLFGAKLCAHSTEVPLTEEESKLYKGCRIEKRLFQLEKETFVVVLVDASANPHAIHPPDFCLKSAGWEVQSKSFRLPRGRAQRIQAAKGQSREEILTWFSQRDQQYSGTLRYRLQLALHRLSLGYLGRAPLVVILSSKNQDVHWPRFLVAYPELAAL